MLHTQPATTVDLSQLHLIGKFVQFLTKYQPEKKELIAKLKAATVIGATGGLCSGFATVALYGLWLENQPAASAATANTAVTPSSATQNVPDSKEVQIEASVNPNLLAFKGDWRWTTVNNILKTISAWDGKTNLSMADMQDFDRVIRQVTYFHYIDNHIPVAQGSLAESFADDKGNKIHQEFAVGGLMHYLDFAKDNIKCKTDSATVEDIRAMYLFRQYKPVLISSHNHATCVLKTPEKFFFYNANNPQGMIEFPSMDNKAISNLLKTIYSENQLGFANPAPLGLRVFRFNGEGKPYPTHEDFLQNIALLPAKPNLYDNFTALHIAAKVGSLQSVDFYLTPSKLMTAEMMPTFVDTQDTMGRTAVFLAAQSGYTDILQRLHKAKADMGMPNKEGTTPLYMACQANHLGAATALLQMNVRHDIQTDQGATALHIAAERGHINIVNVLLAHGANPFITSNQKTLCPIDCALKNGHNAVALCLLTAMEKLSNKDCQAYLQKLDSSQRDALLALKAEAANAAMKSVPAHVHLQSAAMVSVALRSAPHHVHADAPAMHVENAGKDNKVQAQPVVLLQARREVVLPHTPAPPNPREHEDRIENESDQSSCRKKY